MEQWILIIVAVEPNGDYRAYRYPSDAEPPQIFPTAEEARAFGDGVIEGDGGQEFAVVAKIEGDPT
jgi:hypothetical protein